MGACRRSSHVGVYSAENGETLRCGEKRLGGVHGVSDSASASDSVQEPVGAPSREIKSQTDVVGVFPNPEALLRLALPCRWSNRTNGLPPTAVVWRRPASGRSHNQPNAMRVLAAS